MESKRFVKIFYHPGCSSPRGSAGPGESSVATSTPKPTGPETSGESRWDQTASKPPKEGYTEDGEHASIAQPTAMDRLTEFVKISIRGGWGQLLGSSLSLLAGPMFAWEKPLLKRPKPQ